MLLFELRSDATEHGNCETLGPSVMKQSHTRKKRECFVITKFDLCSLTRCFVAIERVVRYFRFRRAWVPPEVAVGVQEPFHPSPKFRAWRSRRFAEHHSDRFLNLIALVKHVTQY